MQVGGASNRAGAEFFRNLLGARRIGRRCMMENTWPSAADLFTVPAAARDGAAATAGRDRGSGIGGQDQFRPFAAARPWEKPQFAPHPRHGGRGDGEAQAAAAAGGARSG